MIAIYVRWIKTGRMSLAEVPVKWRREVENALND